MMTHPSLKASKKPTGISARFVGLLVLGIGVGAVIVHASTPTPHAHANDGISPTYLSAAQVQDLAADRVVTLSAYYQYASSLSELAASSSLIIVGQVVDSGNQRLVPQPTSQASNETSATDTPSSGEKQDTTNIPPAPTFEANSAPQDLPVTTFSIELLQVVKGDVQVGSNIAVDQAGGTIDLPTYSGGPTLHRTIVFEDSPMLSQGEQVLLFLGQTPEGNYYILNGSQGHFAIIQDVIYATVPGIPVAKDVDGLAIEGFIGTIPLK